MSLSFFAEVCYSTIVNLLIRSMLMANRLLFPPTTAQDMAERGWDAADFGYVIGDA